MQFAILHARCSCSKVNCWARAIQDGEIVVNPLVPSVTDRLLLTEPVWGDRAGMHISIHRYFAAGTPCVRSQTCQVSRLLTGPSLSIGHELKH